MTEPLKLRLTHESWEQMPTHVYYDDFFRAIKTMFGDMVYNIVALELRDGKARLELCDWRPDTNTVKPENMATIIVEVPIIGWHAP